MADFDKFLSTLSLRRATFAVVKRKKNCLISIHALLAESDTVPDLGKRDIRISIHALLAESDPGPKVMTPDRYYFYPRSPCGERRQAHADGPRSCAISIHALLAESDGGIIWRHIIRC